MKKIVIRQILLFGILFAVGVIWLLSATLKSNTAGVNGENNPPKEINSGSLHPTQPLNAKASEGLETGQQGADDNPNALINQSAAQPAKNDILQQKKIGDLNQLLNSDSFEALAKTFQTQVDWDLAKHETMLQAHTACQISASRLLLLKTGKRRIVPPMQMHIEHIKALANFLATFCKNYKLTVAGANIPAVSNYGDDIVKSMNPEYFRPESLNKLIVYARREYQPQLAYQITRSAVLEGSSNFAIAELLQGDAAGSLSRLEIVEAYALAAETLACQKSNACTDNRPYTILQCLDRSACEVGQSLSTFRQRWTSPAVWASAQRLAAKWHSLQ